MVALVSEPKARQGRPAARRSEATEEQPRGRTRGCGFEKRKTLPLNPHPLDRAIRASAIGIGIELEELVVERCREADPGEIGQQQQAREPADENTPYNPPGVTGVFKLLHDKELWATLSPLIAGAKAFSTAAADAEDQGESSKSAPSPQQRGS